MKNLMVLALLSFCFCFAACNNDEFAVPDKELGFLENTSWSLITHDTIPVVFSESQIDFRRDMKGNRVMWYKYTYNDERPGVRGDEVYYTYEYPHIYPTNGVDNSWITDIAYLIFESPFRMKATLRSGEVVYYEGKNLAKK